jgi:hypothetical protein
MSNFLMLEDTHTTWLVREVFSGETYGQWSDEKHDFVLTFEPEKKRFIGDHETLVEFYDMQCSTFRPYSAQIVQRYQRQSILDRAKGGMDLDGGVPRWTISKEGMETVRRWLAHHSQTDLKHFADNPQVCVPVAIASNEAAWGGPGMKLFHVFVTREEFSQGQHLEVAEKYARDIQMEDPLVSFCGQELAALTGTVAELGDGYRANPQYLGDKSVIMILAALRWYQSSKESGQDLSETSDIIDPGEVSSSEIDKLCQKLNFGS